jgi:hypothetical protein
MTGAGAAVILAAVVFAVVQLAQHDVRWLQLACITSTGTLYRWIRWRSGSTTAGCHCILTTDMLTLMIVSEMIEVAF